MRSHKNAVCLLSVCHSCHLTGLKSQEGHCRSCLSKKSHCDFLMDGLVDAQHATEAGERRRGDPLQRVSERDIPPPAPSTTGNGCPESQSLRAGRCCSYSGGGLRLCSFRSSRLFQYLKLLSKCCIRLGRSAKAGERITKQQSWHFYS